MAYPTVFMDAVTSYKSSATTALGTKRAEANKEYIYVYTSNAVGSNRAVTLLSGVVTYEVTPTTVVSGVAVGFNQTGAAVPASSYFWAQTKGYGTVEQVEVSGCLNGSKLVIASTSGTVDDLDTTAATVVGQSMAAIGDYSLNIDAYIDCN